MAEQQCFSLMFIMQCKYHIKFSLRNMYIKNGKSKNYKPINLFRQSTIWFCYKKMMS